MRRGIYAVVDHKAQDLHSIMMLFAHEVVALRTFYDSIKHQESAIAKNPEDYDLVRLGWLEDDLTITPENTTLKTGPQAIEDLMNEERRKRAEAFRQNKGDTNASA